MRSDQSSEDTVLFRSRERFFVLLFFTLRQYLVVEPG